MIQPSKLLNVARDLTIRNNNPTQEHLRRAVSTIYYAMFHSLCYSNADSLVGSQFRNDYFWVKVYRALNHNVAKKKCEKIGGRGFDKKLERFAKQFCQLQPKRHAADYDPWVAIKHKEVLADLMVTEYCMNGLHRVSRANLIELAVYLLFTDR